MTLTPLLQASVAIQIHTLAALAAFGLGAVQLAGPKGTGLHRGLGWVWVAAMGTTAASSFWVTELIPGWPSPIHLLSVFALGWLPLGVLAARRHQGRRHRLIMLGLFFGAICATGAFTLLPGRIMHAVALAG